MDVAVVWMDGAPDAEAQKSVSEWGIRHGVRVVSPAAAQSTTLTPRDEDARTVEDSLAKARDALAQQDGDNAERQLARAEQTLRAHPELPQGAWLMAEVMRGWASRFARVAPVDAQRAARAWIAAEAMDGGRATGVGEPSFDSHARAVTITLEAASNAAVLWDGLPISVGSVKTKAGEHHLVATVAGHIVFAQWVSVDDGSLVSIQAAGAAPCSQGDFATAPRGVSCGDWIMVRHGTGTALSITSCSRDVCGTEIVWAPLWSEPFGPAIDRGGFHWPAWATWTLVGLAVIGGTLGIMAAAGVFSEAPPPLVTFKNGGIEQH